MGSDRLPPLKDIDAIELVTWKWPSLNWRTKNQGVIPLTKAQTERVLELWSKLMPGESARCHEPPFGLRLYRDRTIMYEITPCWKCDNIALHCSNLKRESGLYGVEMGTEPARELLDYLMAIRDGK